ncbi:sensor histidine kinase [Blautia sp. HCP3S3_H10_1]|uniref:sensor histidine kinase n=1 Tax=unclassified Blautia TaxID=2648079 RepID=UPI003F8DAA4F
MIQHFFDQDRDKVLKLAEDLDTAVGFLKTDNGFYIVRNMMNRSFTSWGILVSRVNVDYCFEPVKTAWEDFGVVLTISGIPVVRDLKNTNEDAAAEELAEKQVLKNASAYEMEKGEVYIFSNQRENDYDINLVLYAKELLLFRFLYGYFYVIFAMGFALIPMMIMFMRLSGKEMSKPVEKLMNCAEEIEKGNLGYQVDTPMENLEFEYLRNSINQMSGQLKYQFDHIYEEELALRDARIMALQSHINPHFMSNTLEIINWEARLGGNEKVSKMIGALSTLMDAAMDRKGLPEVKLSQEMIYVNAYFYIIAERLGKRLTVERQIPEELMGMMVPRLIMQPIIENAIEHGIIQRGGGTVLLRAHRDEKYLYIEIVNDGSFGKENEEKVKRLLAPDYDARKESSGNLGIANVNQRLRILYGENCGLTIKSYNDEQTISILTILVNS